MPLRTAVCYCIVVDVSVIAKGQLSRDAATERLLTSGTESLVLAAVGPVKYL